MFILWVSVFEPEVCDLSSLSSDTHAGLVVLPESNRNRAKKRRGFPLICHFMGVTVCHSEQGARDVERVG